MAKEYNVKPKARHRQVFEKVVETHGSISTAMREVGYPPNTAKNPKNLTETKGWKQLMEEYLSDNDLAQKHKELLNATKIDHMVFMLGPRNEAEREQYIAQDRAKADEKGIEYKEIEYVSDDDIREMLAEVNCKVRRIVHRETARDVYFWAADNKSRKDAIDMGYKLKGSYAPDKSITATVNLTPENVPQHITKEYEDKVLASIINGNTGATQHHSVVDSKPDQE